MKRICLLAVAILFTQLRPVGAWGQVDSAMLALADLVKTYNRFGMYNPQEKVYLHFDNTGYYLGETIWFQAYVVAAPQLRPTELSKVLYVELLTPEGRVVETKKLKIEDGRANGEFSLTDGTLVGGFYEVRAYTRVMLNWEGTYFSRIFPVFDRPDREGIYLKKITKRPRSKTLPQYREEASSQPTLNIAFFPEGGNLVEGLPSVLAFKATDKEGRSCEVEGFVMDNSGNPIAEIATQHQGMGKFLLTPSAESYKAIVNRGGKEYRFTLPAVQKEGYVMTVNTLREEKLLLQVQRSPGLPGEWVGITVSCRGIAYGFDVADMREKTSVQLQFAQESFPSGVLQITLFNARGDILAERLSFHDVKPQITLRIDSLKPLYKPFEPINLHFTLSGSRQVALPSTFSLAVRDYATEVPTYHQGDMRTNFLLESDLRGYIENISYYFEADDMEHKENLDLLMRVQGWRRYAWRQLAGLETFEPHHPAEEGILVKGQVYRYRMMGSRPEPDVNVSIWIYSSSFSCKGTVQSDDAGRFAFLSDSDIWGRCEMILRTQTPDKGGELKDRDLVVELDRVFSPKPESYPAVALTLPDSNLNHITYALEEIEEEEEEEELAMDKKIHNLSEVSVKAKRQPLSDRPSIVYSVADEEDRLIDTHETGYADGIPTLLERINPYFSIRSDDGEDIVCTYKNRPVKFVYRSMNQYMGDWADADELYGLEMPSEGRLLAQTAGDEEEGMGLLGDSSLYEPSIRDISNRDVKKIEIVELMNVVLVKLYGYPYVEQRKERKGLRMTTLQGYSKPQEYYRIDYGRGALPDEGDYRRTLYWNPNVPIDSSGKAYVSFYNNSMETRLRVDAETLTSDGEPGGVH